MIARFRKSIAALAAVAALGAVAAIPSQANAWWSGPHWGSHGGFGWHGGYGWHGYGFRAYAPNYAYGYNGGCLRVRNVVDYYGNVIGTKLVNVCY